MADINGTSSSETLLGTDKRDNINGLAGDDIIDGDDGRDTITDFTLLEERVE